MRETTVSAKSTLNLCNAVAWGRMSYKAYIGDLKRAQMLEKIMRHVYLEACNLSTHLSMSIVRLAAGLGGLDWTLWYDRLMKRRVASIKK